MISHLKGTIILKQERFIILEVGGVGYKVFLSQRSMDGIPEPSQELKVFCYLNVGERALELYGFLSFEELNLFEMLRQVPGIGPAAALDICSCKSPEEIRQAIKQGDIEFLQAIKGIGKKKAQKIVLELSGKLKQPGPSGKQEKDMDDEAVSALVNLGFTEQEAKTALSQLPDDIKDPQARVKQALKMLAK